MGKIEWKDSYSVNNIDIDRQHKKWIEIYNNVLGQFTGKNSITNADLTVNALKNMQEYTQYHFDFEMEYMSGILYPGIALHRRFHKNFDVLIYNLLRQANEGNFPLCSEILKTIENWLLDHILIEDKKYCEFAAKQDKNLNSK